jgi:hypothetical protein
MKIRHIAIAAAALLGSTLTQAQTLRPVLGFGLTFGGDLIREQPFNDGSTQKLTAGQLLHLYGGARYFVSPDMSVSTTIGYHVDDVTASNGSLKFSRFPLEVLGQMRATEQIWVGAGLRKALSPSYSATGAGVTPGINPNPTVTSSPGFVLSSAYQISDMLGFSLRYVIENYKVDGVDKSGNHGGIYMDFTF